MKRKIRKKKYEKQPQQLRKKLQLLKRKNNYIYIGIINIILV